MVNGIKQKEMIVETRVHTYIIKIAHKLNTTQLNTTEISVIIHFLKKGMSPNAETEASGSF